MLTQWIKCYWLWMLLFLAAIGMLIYFHFVVVPKRDAKHGGDDFENWDDENESREIENFDDENESSDNANKPTTGSQYGEKLYQQNTGWWDDVVNCTQSSDKSIYCKPQDNWIWPY